MSCPRCSDGFKYPEKFLINLLDQLNNPYEFQKSFDWSQNKKYDFYVPFLKCIIETHGKQHYEYTGRGRSLKEEQDNDQIKEKLAISNRIENYIVIDCRHSEMDWIKNNVLNSELNNLIDLSKIDWKKCHEFAFRTIVRVTCDLWNEGNKVSSIINKLNLSISAVTKYLKQGAEIGWCDYDPKEEMRKSSKKTGKNNRKKVVQLTLDGDYIRTWSSARDISDDLEINYTNISSVCRGKTKTAGGFIWMFKSDYEKSNAKILESI